MDISTDKDLQIAALHRTLEPVLLELRKYTYPLMVEGRSRRPELISTGVFIEVDEVPYLISAAHAMENFQTSKVIGTRNGETFVPLSGQVAHTGFGKIRDTVDIAAMRLTHEFVHKYSLNVVPIQMLSTSVQVINPQCRAVVGYPLSKNKALYNPATSDFREYIFSYVGFADFHADYARFNKSKNDHIGMEYGPGTTDTGKLISEMTHPRGMSGGGAWLIPDLKRPNLFFLEGIFIELHAHGRQRYTFSTRIEHAIHFVRFMNHQKTWG